MGKLRDKMAADLQLRRYRSETCRHYLDCARRFAEHFGRSPTLMGEPEIRAFLLYLINDRKVSPSTQKVYIGALGFHHVVFTLPSELRALALRNRETVYDLLFQCASQTLLELGRDPKWLGARLGVTAVLHTWTRDLSYHPHLHCLVTAGGLSLDGERWVDGRKGYLVPLAVLGALFRGKMLAALTQAYQRGELDLGGCAAELRDPLVFARLRDALYKMRYVMLSARVLLPLRTYGRVERPKGPALFPGKRPGTTACQSAVRNALQRAAARCKIGKHVTPRVLRHNFATPDGACTRPRRRRCQTDATAWRVATSPAHRDRRCAS
jgi:hypothetical protein